MTDRMNHMFWKYCDKTHRKYDPHSKYINTLKEFYIFIDKKIGELIKLLDKDVKIIIWEAYPLIQTLYEPVVVKFNSYSFPSSTGGQLLPAPPLLLK